jgi:hypothetical protein
VISFELRIEILDAPNPALCTSTYLFVALSQDLQKMHHHLLATEDLNGTSDQLQATAEPIEHDKAKVPRQGEP